VSFCPLCQAKKSLLYAKDKKREYQQCLECLLVYVPKKYYLDEVQEKARYDLHTNDTKDKGYKTFLSKVFNPLVKQLPRGAKGLDFGSGPGPMLSLMFEEAGFEMKVYDHFYAKDEAVLQNKYDFITSTEVVEHLYAPKEVLDSLWLMLNEKGLLALLTQTYPEKEAFEKWWYKNDPTHVCFFSLKTMQFLAQKYKAHLEVVGKDVFIFKKAMA